MDESCGDDDDDEAVNQDDACITKIQSHGWNWNIYMCVRVNISGSSSRLLSCWLYANPDNSSQKITMKEATYILREDKINNLVVDFWCDHLVTSANTKKEKDEFAVFDSLIGEYMTCANKKTGGAMDEESTKIQLEELKFDALYTEKTLLFPVNSDGHWVLMELDTETSHWTVYNSLSHDCDNNDFHFTNTAKVRRYVEKLLIQRANNPVRGSFNNVFFTKFATTTFTETDRPNSPQQVGVDCGIICLMIMENRLAGDQVSDIIHSEKYSFEMAGKYRAKMVSTFLNWGERHKLTNEALVEEVRQAEIEEQARERVRKRTEQNPAIH